jgi:hypothetical protein
MKDLLNNELCLGDKIAFIPKKSDSCNIQYGMISYIFNNPDSAYCKSLSEPYISNVVRYQHQIIKLT